MSRQPTKARGNRYCEARLKAAEYNETFLTRAGAAESLPGVTAESLKLYELGKVNPPNDVVAFMADAYNAPELRNWYCANVCTLGVDCRDFQTMPAERVLLRSMNIVDKLENGIKLLAEIMDDGELSAEESKYLPEIRERFLEIRRRIDEMLSMLERADKLGKF